MSTVALRERVRSRPARGFRPAAAESAAADPVGPGAMEVCRAAPAPADLQEMASALVAGGAGGVMGQWAKRFTVELERVQMTATTARAPMGGLTR